MWIDKNYRMKFICEYQSEFSLLKGESLFKWFGELGNYVVLLSESC